MRSNAGFGIERAPLDFCWSVWKRYLAYERISTFVDPLLRARTAGTTPSAMRPAPDVVIGTNLPFKDGTPSVR